MRNLLGAQSNRALSKSYGRLLHRLRIRAKANVNSLNLQVTTCAQRLGLLHSELANSKRQGNLVAESIAAEWAGLSHSVFPLTAPTSLLSAKMSFLSACHLIQSQTRRKEADYLSRIHEQKRKLSGTYRLRSRARSNEERLLCAIAETRALRHALVEAYAQCETDENTLLRKCN